MFQRRSTSGTSVPSWLTDAETALLKRHVRQSKQDPLCDEVEILDVNPSYAHIRTGDGVEKTVAIKHLSPSGTLSPDDLQPTTTTAANPPPVQVNRDAPHDPVGVPMELPAPQVIQENPVSPTRVANPGSPAPLMGGHGEHYCNVDLVNILPGRSRRHKQ